MAFNPYNVHKGSENNEDRSVATPAVVYEANFVLEYPVAK